MINKKIFLIGMFFLIGIMFLSLGSAYMRSNMQGVIPSYGGMDSGFFTSSLDTSQCEAGQDFIIQVAPFGCEPAVVRSDLLEDQQVAVACQLAVTKLNSLIEVEAIDYLTFSGDYPQEIASVGFHPAQSALGISGALNSPVLNNIGYAVFVLRQNPNETSMPDVIEMNLTAKVRYNIENAFGIGRGEFYLPEMSDNEWNDKKNQNSFWEGRGYVRAEAVDTEGARISLYSDRNNAGLTGSGDKLRITSVYLKEGQVSGQVYMPGFDPCMASLKVRLNGLESPDTYAKLEINGDVFEVKEGEKFLENRCMVRNLDKKGLSQEVEIECQEDDIDGYSKRTGFNLIVAPKIKMKVGGNEGDYEIGDYLYTSENRHVYLGYAGTARDSENPEDLYALLVSSPTKEGDKLTSAQLQSVSNKAHLLKKYNSGGNFFGDVTTGISKAIGAGWSVWNWLGEGEGIKFVYVGGNFEFQGESVSVIGFGDEENIYGLFESLTLDEDKFTGYYENALDDFDNVFESFSGEKESEYSQTTFGEEAFYEKIVLARNTGQKKTMLELCEDFKQRYPDSVKTLVDCGDEYRNSNSEISTQSVLINGDTKVINFRSISEPSEEDYSAEIVVGYPDNTQEVVTLTKNQLIYLNEEAGEYIQLVSLEEDSARIAVSLKPEGFGEEAIKYISGSDKKIELDVTTSFQSDYSFTLKKVNLEKVARVSIIPNIDYAESESSFKAKIEIEKRGIKLSPDKTEERIENLNKTIGNWASVADGLGGVVKGLKAACIGTGGILVTKNMIQNAGGKGISRQKVMQGSGGWNEFCLSEFSEGKYSSQDACFHENAEAIEGSVNNYFGILEAQNSEIKNIEDASLDDKTFLSEKYVNTDKFVEGYSKVVQTNLGKVQGVEGTSEVKELLTSESWEARNYNVEDLRDIDFYSRALQSNPNDELAKQRLTSLLKDVSVNSENYLELVRAKESANSKGLVGMNFNPYSDETKRQEVFQGIVTNDKSAFGNIGAGQNIQGIFYNGKQYYATLEDLGANKYAIIDVYDLNGNKVDADNVIKLSYSHFKKYDASLYENEYKNAEVSFYETEPYKGYPALVPFDQKNGWYAYVKQTLPVLGKDGSYDLSGRLDNFYLCNVGENNLEEFDENLGDDICQYVDLGIAGTYKSFYGLDEGETFKLVNAAQNAIENVQRQRTRKAGLTAVTVNGQRYKVGSPAVDIPETRCTDFMSPKDCTLLFNLCDPVICPSSRCDFGGNYPVQDVAQSGIVGSIALCLPNWKEGVKIPVCLTGVKAGIDNLVSVQESYRDCLQTSLDTGETVGVCDEIHSVYLCEFFWRQSLPLAKLAVPRILGVILGQNVHGGGEYLGIVNAFSNAEDSLKFFTQNYAVESTKAFRLRNAEDVGGEVCKSFASLSYPGGADIFDKMTEPDSPPQFSARFDEIPFTTATNPPVSHYKVSYHIYAGGDSGAYYQVYLSEGSESSFYQDTTFRRIVSSGYIEKGSYASETPDFTAPSGYKELCVVVNDYSECGFKEVSTSFAKNYVKEAYLVSQADETDVKSEKECISGSVSAYSLLNPNVQSAGEDLISPEIYNQGITRICATNNPGKGTDVYYGTEDQRWLEVGYCGEKEIKCWIDTQSVEEIIKFSNLEEGALSDLTNNQLDILQKEGNYVGNDKFEAQLKKIKETNSSNEKISLIGEIFEKVYFNNQKAELLLLRGKIYSVLAFEEYKKIKEKAKKKASSSSTSSLDLVENIIDIANSKIGQVCGKDCFDAVYTIYGEAGAGINCVYSAGYSKKRSQPSCIACGCKENAFGKCYDCPREQYELKQGDLIQVYNANTVSTTGGHNLIFGEWTNEDKKVANLWDQITATQKIRYRTNYDLIESPVTVIWEPVGVGGSSSTTSSDDETVKSTEKKSYISSSFEFKDGLASWNGNVYYKYFDEEWHWSFSDENWVKLDSLTDQLNDVNKNLVKSLKSKDYFEGFNLLVKEILKDEGGTLGGGMLWIEIRAMGKTIFHPELATEKTYMTHEGIFGVDKTEGIGPGGKIFFIYEDGWKWAYGGNDKNKDMTWVEVPNVGKHPVFSSSELSDFEKGLILSLEDKTMLEGAVTLFDLSKGGTADEIDIREETFIELNSEIDQSKFTSKELEEIRLAERCASCGSDLSGCTEELCESIGIQIGEYCELEKEGSYYSGSRNCVSKGKREKEFIRESSEPALVEIESLISKYGLMVELDENEDLINFVNSLKEDNVLSEDEWEELSGEGIFDFVETLGELKNFLLTGSMDYTFETASEGVDALLKQFGDIKINYLPLKSFAFKLKVSDILTNDEYVDMATNEGMFNVPEKLSDLKNLLVEKQIASGGSFEKEIGSISEALKQIEVYLKEYGNVKLASESELELFVLNLKWSEIINDGEYQELSGKGIFDTAEDLEYLKNLLREKQVGEGDVEEQEDDENTVELFEFCGRYLIKSEYVALDNLAKDKNFNVNSLCSTIVIKNTHVTFLYLGSREISNISFLKSFTALEDLNLQNNNVADISPLEQHINYWSLKVLNVDSNCLSLDDVNVNAWKDDEFLDVSYEDNPRDDC
jgi:hypothetical protein